MIIKTIGFGYDDDDDGDDDGGDIADDGDDDKEDGCDNDGDFDNVSCNDDNYDGDDDDDGDNIDDKVKMKKANCLITNEPFNFIYSKRHPNANNITKIACHRQTS